VGVAACLRKHGRLPRPDEIGGIGGTTATTATTMPILTGVSAGSMIAAAILVGVNPDPDGMEVVLEASRRTRELRRRPTGRRGGGGKSGEEEGGFGMSLDALTPGFSLIDQVEGPFRDALAKALDNAVGIHDVDPHLFRRRVPDGTLRIGLTDRRGLWPISLPVSSYRERFLDSYRYVDAYRNVEDVVAACMLSSYIPGLTGPLSNNARKDDYAIVPALLSGFMKTGDSVVGSGGGGGGAPSSSEKEETCNKNDASVRAGYRLNEMTNLGLVKHGRTGLPIAGAYVPRGGAGLDVDDGGGGGSADDDANGGGDDAGSNSAIMYWDGGIVDVFPTIDERTVVVAPVNGFFDPNPSICPRMPEEVEGGGNHSSGDGATENGDRRSPRWNRPAMLLDYLRPYVPTTFRHCRKSRLGLNAENADAALRMMFSSDDDEMYSRFRGGYDDAR
jgi:hypothetical protein